MTDKLTTELDPTTGKIISALVKPLAKDLNAAMQTSKILEAFEQLQNSANSSQKTQSEINKSLENVTATLASQPNIANTLKNLRAQVNSLEKFLDKSQAELKNNHNSLAQSTENILEEISGLRIVLENMSASFKNFQAQISKLSQISQNAQKSQTPQQVKEPQIPDNILNELDLIAKSTPKIIDELLASRRSLDNLSANIQNHLDKIIASHSKNISDKIANSKPDFHELHEFLRSQFTSISQKIESQQQISNANSQAQTQIPNDNTNIGEYIHGIEGVLRAHSMSQTRELETFSNEIHAANEQLSISAVNKLQKSLSENLTAKYDSLHEKFTSLSEISHANNSEIAELRKLAKIMIIISGTSIFFAIITFITLLFK